MQQKKSPPDEETWVGEFLSTWASPCTGVQSSLASAKSRGRNYTQSSMDDFEHFLMREGFRLQPCTPEKILHIKLNRNTIHQSRNKPFSWFEFDHRAHHFAVVSHFDPKLTVSYIA